MGEDDLSGLIDDVAARLHLGEYEREAYLTVLEHGSIAASELADRTAIPQPRVYDTVRALGERGLVEVHESRPMRVVAVDPAEAFAGITQSMETLVDGLRTRYSAPDPEQAAVSLIKSRSTIIRNIGRIIDGADYELSLSLTPETLGRFEGNLADARDRGVSTELIVAPAAQAPAPEAFPYRDVASSVRARRGLTTPVIAVADGVRSIYATQDAFDRDEDRYGVVFNRSALGFLLFGFYGTVLWTTAEPVYETEGPLEFPHRFASVRRCIKELRDLDGTFHARVAGRWVDTAERCELTGRIVEATMEETGEVATLSLETGEGTVTIGGRLAAYEDLEAHELAVGRDGPPS